MPGPTPTDEQRDLINHHARTHARVLAGPGTGKSFTLVAFLEQLLGRSTAPKVKLLTFTRAATAELAEKVAGHPAAGAEKPSTIHSFAITVLLQNPGTGNFPHPLRIADKWEERNIVEPTLRKRAGLKDVYRLRDLVSKMAANWESLTDLDFGVAPEEKAKFLGTWNEHRRVLGYTLLAELPYALLKALEVHDELKGLDYELLLVDEYQDLNACDLALLKSLAERGCTIVGSGDDDQSIYSGRKADPAGIRRFLEDYPGASNYPLSVTLRCGKKILEWARFVIEGDPGRDPARPPLLPAPTSPDGEVALLQFKGEVSEANGIADLVDGLIKKEGLEPRDILILVRTDNNRTFTKPIREKLQARGIKCTDPNEVQDILAEDDNRRALAMLRLLVFPRDSLAWATLLRLSRGIGDRFFEYVYNRALPEQKTFADALLEANAASYPDDAPKASANKARELVGSVLPWTTEMNAPDKPPEDGWHAWLNEQIEAMRASRLRAAGTHG
jgi:DNA helicase-2/ATP-dependent DNA helicase PcrA